MPTSRPPSRGRRAVLVIIVAASLGLLGARQLSIGAAPRYLGVAVTARPLADAPGYATSVAATFSSLTTENALKFAEVHPAPGRYDFADADAIVAFAATHGMRVRGHALVWHRRVPAWVTAVPRSRDEMAALLRDHITTVVSRYRGRVAEWDVVNEAIDDDGRLRDSIWLRTIGPEYLALAFTWAHAADPQARLFYNDYGGEGLSRKSAAIYGLLRDLRSQGVPVHGVGMQAHLTLSYAPAPLSMLASMARLEQLGLRVVISELDVRLPEGAGAAERERQRAIYSGVGWACRNSGACDGVTVWGLADCLGWSPRCQPNPAEPLLFDSQLRPKPLLPALLDALRPAPPIH